MKKVLSSLVLFLIVVSVFFDSTLAALPEKRAENEAMMMPTGMATSVNISRIAGWYYEGASNGDDLGIAVSSVGDLNGDGFDDIVIGAPLHTRETPNAVENEGAVFVFLGSAGGLKNIPDCVFGGGLKGSQFGRAVSGAGDVNGDGYADFIVGAPEYQVDLGVSGIPKSGAAFLFFGSADGVKEDPYWLTLAEAREIRYGGAVAAAGDVNQDGYDDVLVAAPLLGDGEVSEGKVYLYLGSENGPETEPFWTYQCNRSTARCGNSLAGIGDINQDGYVDILVGAPGYDGEFQDEGMVLLFLGESGGLSSTATQLLEGDQPGAEFGTSVSGLGDVNGDGYPDVVVGAPLFDGSDRPDLGAAFVYYGSDAGLISDAPTKIFGNQEGSLFGFHTSAAGDVNQDGLMDVLVGAYRYGENGIGSDQPDEGAAYIFLGSERGSQTGASWLASGNKADAWFGFAVGSAGDINGDGMADMIVGAPNYRFDDKTILGRAFVYFSQLNPEEPDMYFSYLPIVVILSE